MQSARQSARTFRDGWLPFGVGAQVAYANTAVPLSREAPAGAVVHFEGDAPHHADPLIRYTMVTWRK